MVTRHLLDPLGWLLPISADPVGSGQGQDHRALDAPRRPRPALAFLGGQTVLLGDYAIFFM